MPISENEVSKILAIEFAFYAHTPITPELVMAWFTHFRTVERDDFYAAIHIAVAENTDKFPPTPSEVREVLKRLKATQETLETGELAWENIRLREPKISKRSAQVLAVWGQWKERHNWLTEHVPFRQREFIRLYNDIKEQDEVLEVQNNARVEIGYGREELTQPQLEMLKKLDLGKSKPRLTDGAITVHEGGSPKPIKDVLKNVGVGVR
jgi:hypothetical protein